MLSFFIYPETEEKHKMFVFSNSLSFTTTNSFMGKRDVSGRDPNRFAIDLLLTRWQRAPERVVETNVPLATTVSSAFISPALPFTQSLRAVTERQCPPTSATWRPSPSKPLLVRSIAFALLAHSPPATETAIRRHRGSMPLAGIALNTFVSSDKKSHSAGRCQRSGKSQNQAALIKLGLHHSHS